MKISVIGAGYVGLVAGTCFASFGIDVTCIDLSKEKIDALKNGIIPIYEPSLQDLLSDAISKQAMHFSTDYTSISSSDAVIIAVGTPSSDDGSADLSYVFSSLDIVMKIVAESKKPMVVVIKSTVPIGTAKRLREMIEEQNLQGYIHIVSNPEFLREGCAVSDFLQPDRIVLGAANDTALSVAKSLYSKLIENNTKVVETDNTTAELIKYSANTYLAMRIAFINECADIAEHAGANIDDVALGMGLDSRIGTHYLSPGPAYGGSCFPKDTKALQYYTHANSIDVRIVDAVISSNDARRELLAERAVQIFQKHNCKNIAVLGATFKANTDDMRDSCSISVVKALKSSSFNIAVYDPSFSKEAESVLELNLSASMKATLEKADAAIILTEWDEFKKIDLEYLSGALKNKILIDYRNLFKPYDAKKAGLTYYSIGR